MSEESQSITSSSPWESMNDWFTPKVLFVLLNVMIGAIFFTSSLASRRQKHQNTKNAGIGRSSSVLQRLKSVNLYAHYYRSQDEPQNHNMSHSSFDSDHTHQFSQEYLHLKPQDSYVYEESERTNFVFDEKDAVLDGSPQAHEVRAQSQFTFGHKDRILTDFSQLVHEEKAQSQFDFTQNHEEKNSEQSMDEVYSKLFAGGSIRCDRSKSDARPISGDTPAKSSARMRKSASLKSALVHFEEDEVIITAESRRPATSRVSGSSKPADGDSEVDAKADDFINKFKRQLKLQRLDSIIRYKDMIARGTAKG